MIITNYNKQDLIKGASVIEIVIVISVLVVVLTSIFLLLNFSLRTSDLQRNTVGATAIAQETIEAARNFRDQTDWNVDGLGVLTIGSDYYPETAGNPLIWTMIAGQENIDIFTRSVVFSRVYRDGNDSIADAGIEDSDSRKLTITVSWQENGQSREVKIITYLTNWSN